MLKTLLVRQNIGIIFLTDKAHFLKKLVIIQKYS
jgi:hypothetical protein